MIAEKLVCDVRSGCVAIYKQSRVSETNGLHRCDNRNIAYSDKDSHFDGNYWSMDAETIQIFQDMVIAYNEKFFKEQK